MPCSSSLEGSCQNATSTSRTRLKEDQLKSYVFRVVLEPDQDAWRAFIPELEAKGAATWGKTKEEALRNIHEVAHMVIEALLEDGEPF
jgi:predicted RNase H-like HicB family nuclease